MTEHGVASQNMIELRVYLQHVLSELPNTDNWLKRELIKQLFYFLDFCFLFLFIAMERELELRRHGLKLLKISPSSFTCCLDVCYLLLVSNKDY